MRLTDEQIKECINSASRGAAYAEPFYRIAAFELLLGYEIEAAIEDAICEED